ncbi:MAG TPA: dTDP-4-amino-4,6-dideoxygalactose transaminase [Vicinamibacteria bacterium]|nr:dTDP-4-amino-4,6-dideoxygalactose transaminase [Vicinamibacteria bacterium]
MGIEVPFNRPALEGPELEYIRQAIASGHIGGNGAFTRRCERLLERELGAPRVLLTTSGTHALELAALLLDVRPGDEVIVPSFTFPSTANAFALRGARIVFSDICAETLTLDASNLERLVTPATRVIVPMHYAGVGCEMAEICATAREYGLDVVEDAAHGLFGLYREDYLGTLGDLGALSFHETKNFSCGEGGALILNDASYVERAEILREKGTNRQQFFRGEVDKYSWEDVGSSYVPSDLLAAFLLAQLERHQAVLAKRRRVWAYYFEGLREWAWENDVGLPAIPDDRVQSYHMFYVVVPTAQDRDALMAHLATSGVQSVFHYLPLHLSKVGRRFGGKPGDCPVTESVSTRLLRLPFFNDCDEVMLARVVSAVQRFSPVRKRHQVAVSSPSWSPRRVGLLPT